VFYFSLKEAKGGAWMSSCGRVFQNFGPEHFTENCMTFIQAG